MFRKEEVNGCGYKVYDFNGNLLGYEGEQTDNGVVYKDCDAFYKRTGEVCYISEYSFPDMYDDFYATVEQAKECGETYQSIVELIRDEFEDEYLLTDKQIEFLAMCAFEESDWACIATLLSQDLWIDDAILFEEKVFTKLQREAVENDCYPRDYAKKEE